MSNVESVTVCVASTNGMTSTEKSKKFQVDQFQLGN